MWGKMVAGIGIIVCSFVWLQGGGFMHEIFLFVVYFLRKDYHVSQIKSWDNSQRLVQFLRRWTTYLSSAFDSYKKYSQSKIVNVPMKYYLKMVPKENYAYNYQNKILRFQSKHSFILALEPSLKFAKSWCLPPIIYKY